eukprot:7708796-Alexandrium_andersonii.AAC.1
MTYGTGNQLAQLGDLKLVLSNQRQKQIYQVLKGGRSEVQYQNTQFPGMSAEDLKRIGYFLLRVASTSDKAKLFALRDEIKLAWE